MYARIAVTGCGGRNQRAQRNRHAQTELLYNQKNPPADCVSRHPENTPLPRQ